MDAQEFRSLQEAYLEVYSSQEIEEAIDPKGAKRQDASKDKKKIDVFAYDRKIGRKNIPPAPKKEEVETDFFDYILEHLVAEGYADTNEAALAIMANMSEEWREDIVEAAKDQSNKQIEKGVKTTYKAGNILDNQHQGRSKGLNKLPAGERKEKTERMRGRLKARRDDLFGERNRREDEARAELKKRYGL